MTSHPPELQTWERDGQQAVADVDASGRVLISIELLAQMLTELGFTKIETVPTGWATHD